MTAQGLPRMSALHRMTISPSDMTIKPPPEHSYRVIAVASELIEGHSTDVKELNEFTVVDRFIWNKGEVYPRALMLLAIGQDVKESDVWLKYAKSDSVVFYIVKR